MGYTRADYQVSLGGVDDSDNVYGIAYGLGVGVKFSNTTSIEAEYTVFPETDILLGVVSPETFQSELITLGFVWFF